jgi:hypothetical protein
LCSPMSSASRRLFRLFQNVNYQLLYIGFFLVIRIYLCICLKVDVPNTML